MNYCHEHKIIVIAHTSLGSPGNCMSDHHAAPPLMEDALIKQIAAAKGKSTSHILEVPASHDFLDNTKVILVFKNQIILHHFQGVLEC